MGVVYVICDELSVLYDIYDIHEYYLMMQQKHCMNIILIVIYSEPSIDMNVATLQTLNYQLLNTLD